MKSLVRKRSVHVAGHKTSVSLEDEFWSAIKEIAVAERTTVFDLVSKIDKARSEHERSNLSSALRLFVLDHYVARCANKDE